MFLFAISFIRKIPDSKPSSPLWKWVLRLSKDIHSLFNRPLAGISITAIGMTSHVLFSLMFYVLGIGLGISVNLIDCLVFIPAVVLAVMLSVSISGWGVREQAFLLSVAAGGVITLMSLPGLAGCIQMKNR